MCPLHCFIITCLIKLILRVLYGTMIVGNDEACWLIHPLRERLGTHKVFTKDQCFYLNYHKFSIKSYVVDVY